MRLPTEKLFARSAQLIDTQKVSTKSISLVARGSPWSELATLPPTQFSPPQASIAAAGREGINLQFTRILFNFDLPWNPMDME
jgi:hypothetical protein